MFPFSLAFHMSLQHTVKILRRELVFMYNLQDPEISKAPDRLGAVIQRACDVGTDPEQQH